MKVKANSQLEHICALDINNETSFTRLTGIICTIGPACRDVATLEQMMEAGMGIARLNFSHADHAYHLETIKNIRKAVENYSKRLGLLHALAIALDTKGPEIRTGANSGGGEFSLKKGDTIRLTSDEAFKEKGSKEKIYVGYDKLLQVCKPGVEVLIDDGLVNLLVKTVTGREVVCAVENDGVLGGRKGVSFDGIQIERSTELTAQDKSDIAFAVQNDLDIIFASFVTDAQAVKEVRRLLGPKGRDIMVVAKIENQRGMQRVGEIIAEADGIMVERGDLGSEIPLRKVFLAQKSVIARCNKAGKPVICATQLLESMTDKPRPTRAESADVANAVLDGADCVMLSAETARGEFPVECVTTMANICQQAEAAIWQNKLFHELVKDVVPPLDARHTSAIAAVEASSKCHAKAIIVLTITGKSAQLIARYRPKCPIIALTRDVKRARQSQLFRAILPLHYSAEMSNDNWLKDLDERVSYAIGCGKSRGFLKTGDPVCIVTGWQQGSGYTNTLRIVNVD